MNRLAMTLVLALLSTVTWAHDPVAERIEALESEVDALQLLHASPIPPVVVVPDPPPPIVGPAPPLPPEEPSGDVVTAADFEYAGGVAIATPPWGGRDENGKDRWPGGKYAEPQGGMDVVGDTLYLTGAGTGIGKFTWPGVTENGSKVVVDMPVARYAGAKGGAHKPTPGGSGNRVGFVFAHGDHIHAHIRGWYDGGGELSHVDNVATFDAETLEFRHFSDVASKDRAHSWVVEVPLALQEEFGPMLLGGTSSQPIVSRFSWGPSAWSIDPTDLDTGEPAPARRLMSSPFQRTFGDAYNQAGTNDLWNHMSHGAVGFIVDDTYMVVGSHTGYGDDAIIYRWWTTNKITDPERKERLRLKYEDRTGGRLPPGYVSTGPTSMWFWSFKLADIRRAMRGEIAANAVPVASHGEFHPGLEFEGKLGTVRARMPLGGMYRDGLLYLIHAKSNFDRKYDQPPVISIWRLK